MSITARPPEGPSGRKRDMKPEEIAAALPSHLILGDKIGEGGVASVYLLRNTKLDTAWALKVFDVNKLSSSSGMSRSLREGRLAARLRHNNVVTIHDVDEVKGFIFMEYVDGPSLSEVVRDGIGTATEFLDIASGVLAGLAEAHTNGIIHGDISSRNILFTKARVPKLVDFGFAQHVEFSSASVGMTPGYASPEHIQNKRITFQSDVFSVGAALYQLATGESPFDWESFAAYAYAILNENPKDPVFRFLNPPSFLAAFLLRALAREQRDRYPSAIEMLQALRARDQETVKVPVSRDRTLPFGRALRHYHRGLEYYRGTSRQEMDWAEHESRKALEHDKKLALAYTGLADVSIFRYMSYFERSMVTLARAEHYCQQALEADPNPPQSHRSLGRVHMMRREFDQARECFRRALVLDPDYMAAHLSLGWCEVDAHDLKAAEEAARIASAIDSEDIEVKLLLARIHYYAKEYDRSMGTAGEAIQLDRRFGRAYYELAMAERALGQFDGARENFRRSIEFQGDPNAHTDLGLLELLVGNSEAAGDAFMRAAHDETFAFLALYYLGVSHQLSGRSSEARSSFERSLALTDQLNKTDPLDPYGRVIGAMSAAALGLTERAQGLRAMARELDPKDGLVGFYDLCAASWLMRKAPGADEIRTVLAMPRSPSQIELTLDPHFSGVLWRG